ETAMAEKQRIHGERYPVDEDFLSSLGEMPPASGIALGFDRLVMLATAAQRIEQVIWTPVLEPGTTTHTGNSDAYVQNRTTNLRSRICAERATAGTEGSRRALRRRAAAGFGRLDRSQRSARSDRAPVRSRCGGARRATARAERPDRRRSALAGRRHCASLSRPRTAQAHADLRGLLPVLLPARDARPRQGERAVGGGA